MKILVNSCIRKMDRIVMRSRKPCAARPPFMSCREYGGGIVVAPTTELHKNNNNDNNNLTIYLYTRLLSP